MPEVDVKGVVSAFFSSRGKVIPAEDFDLFDSEFIDSMELLELIMHLEEEFQLSIDQDLMSVDNFRTLERIAETVAPDGA